MDERLRFPISDQELQRRWKLVRAGMKEQEIDLLVMQNDNQWLGGYVRYFTDVPAEVAYPHTVLFPADDDMTIITSGGNPLPPSPPDFACRGIKSKKSFPYFRSLHYTNTLDAEVVVDYIKKRNDKRVGWINLGEIPAAFYQYLLDNLDGVEFVDVTDMVDEIKAVKSAEEISYIRKTVAVQDIVAAAVPSMIRPGVHEYEIRGEINKLLENLGSEEQLIMMGSSAPGAKTGQYNPFFHNRRINAGDLVLIMIEVNGPGGYYGEIGRTWSLGEPPKGLLKCWEVALEAQKRAAKLIKPGANPADILKANNEFIESKGFLPEGRLFAHGQGYDLVERPAFVPKETMKLKAGMNVAVHPITFTDTDYVFCCDNYLITEDGAELLHKTPQEILVINC